MNNQKILVTGANGFIGKNIFFSLKDKEFDVQGIDKLSDLTDIQQIDVSDKEEFSEYLDKNDFEVIIHCAAIKGLEDCEKNKEKSFRTNTLSTEYIKDYCIKKKCKPIYISSDVVFNGKQGSYKEDDLAVPLNWYGKTKAFSEIILRQIPSATICRTALVIGKIDEDYKQILAKEIKRDVLYNQTLLPQYIKERLVLGQNVKLPKAIISSPTPVELLVDSIISIIQGNISGIFHTAGVDSLSRYDFGVLVSDLLGFGRKNILVDNSKTSSLRPKNIGLSTKYTYKKLNIDTEKYKLQNYLFDLLK